jgi:ABC-2 type transport system ATP-binding protein
MELGDVLSCAIESHDHDHAHTPSRHVVVGRGSWSWATGVESKQEPRYAAFVSRAVLEVRGLVRAYGSVRAVDGLNLTVREGEIYGFLGRNGAGKTTTMRMLMGIIRPDEGEISILGHTARRPSVREKQMIGYVAQEQHFYPWMTCERIGRFVAGFYPSWDEAEFDRLLAAFELPRDRKVSQLSHGMTMKLALALAIAPRPPLLILDEPTAGLDPVARREFLEIVDHLARARSQTVFFSSHLIDEVERIADRVGIIDRGRLIYEGELEHLRASVRRVPAPPPPGFRVLQQNETSAIVYAEPEQLAPFADAEVLSLDDIFIALVARPVPQRETVRAP